MELICCVCGKVKRNNSWVHTEVSEDELLSHGYCLICMEVALKEIKSSSIDSEAVHKDVA
ncbi:MAG: hypothetical protein ACYTFY_03670 [Planctomycetota bacterium]